MIIYCKFLLYKSFLCSTNPLCSMPWSMQSWAKTSSQLVFLTTVFYYNKESLSSCLEGTFVRNDNIFAVSERFLKLNDRNVS